MPVELGLELVTTIGPDRLDSEWETLDHVVDKRNRICLRMLGVDLVCPNPRGIVDGRVLEALDLPAGLVDAVNRSQRKAARKVSVFQCPWGTRATSRAPRGPQPRIGAMLVLIQVSSMNTSLRGSIRP